MWGYTILKWVVPEGETEAHGVIIQTDNGDTQYLTMGEYKVFLKNRENYLNETTVKP
jgi:hypothetical protein